MKSFHDIQNANELQDFDINAVAGEYYKIFQLKSQPSVIYVTSRSEYSVEYNYINNSSGLEMCKAYRNIIGATNQIGLNYKRLGVEHIVSI